MKKALALLLVLVMAMGMSTTAFAAAKFNKNDSAIGFDGLNITGNGFNEGDTKPGDEVSVLINPVLLLTSPAANGVTHHTLGFTRSEIGSKVTLRTKISKGSSAIDEIKFDYVRVTGSGNNGLAHLYVSFADPFKNNSLDGMDFDFTVYPVVDGKAWSDKGVQFEGTITNDDTEVYADNDLVDLFDGQIANVKEYVRKIEYNLGEGVSVWGKGIKNAKYWGIANCEPTDAQDELMTKYDVSELYNLNHIGLASVADYVILNDADPSAYVYDKDMKYLGRGKDKLAFSDTYYLATKMLDIEEEEEEEPDDEYDDVPSDDPIAPPDLGGEDDYLANINDNPGTGR